MCYVITNIFIKMRFSMDLTFHQNFSPNFWYSLKKLYFGSLRPWPYLFTLPCTLPWSTENWKVCDWESQALLWCLRKTWNSYFAIWDYETHLLITGHSGQCRICRSSNVKAQLYHINLFFFNFVEWLLILES